MFLDGRQTLSWLALLLLPVTDGRFDAVVWGESGIQQRGPTVGASALASIKPLLYEGFVVGLPICCHHRILHHILHPGTHTGTLCA